MVSWNLHSTRVLSGDPNRELCFLQVVCTIFLYVSG